MAIFIVVDVSGVSSFVLLLCGWLGAPESSELLLWSPVLRCLVYYFHPKLKLYYPLYRKSSLQGSNMGTSCTQWAQEPLTLLSGIQSLGALNPKKWFHSNEFYNTQSFFVHVQSTALFSLV
jgi:hypothetical protein